MKQLNNMTEQEFEAALTTNAQRQRPHSPKELDQIVDWAHRIVTQFSILDMAIRGNLGVQMLDGEVRFTPLKPPAAGSPGLLLDECPLSCRSGSPSDMALTSNSIHMNV